MLKIKKVINLSGKMSVLGVSKISEEVMEAMHEASQHFYVIKDLEKTVEAEIAKKFGASDAFITASASAGIAMSIAAAKAKLLKNGEKRKVKVLLPYGHFIDYGAPIKEVIELGGAEVIGIGAVNRLSIADLEESLAHEADVAFYVSSHHAVNKNHIANDVYAKFFKEHNITTMIDIAAEENVWKFVKVGFDFTILSGSKAIAGPTSGVVFSSPENKKLLEPQRSHFARTMKISKENIIGLNKAVELYSKERVISVEEKEIDSYVKLFKDTKFDVSVSEDKLRGIKRIKLFSIELINSLVEAYHKNDIYAREYQVNNGYVELDLRQTTKKELLKTLEVTKEI